MKTTLFFLTQFVMLIFILGCVAMPNEFVNTVNSEGEIAGFWLGLWHGVIAPFMFILTLFVDSIGIYEIHNSGGGYNFGYIIGLSMSLGSGCGAHKYRNRCC